MRKAISTLLILSTLFCMVFASSGCGKITPDYEAPLEMYSAFSKGENIVGKKVEFTANWDYMESGKIFDCVTPDFSCLITIFAKNKDAEKIKSGDTVIVRITKVETELAGLDVYGDVL